jgi:hypothetical protein
MPPDVVNDDPTLAHVNAGTAATLLSREYCA